MTDTTKIIFEGGPLDGKEEWRELRPEQDEICILMQQDASSIGYYHRGNSIEGLAVFEWKGSK